MAQTAFDNLQEASALLAAAGEPGNYFVGEDGSLRIDECILRLGKALASGGAGVTVEGMADSGTATFVVDALASPFQEASSALRDLLIPEGTVLDDDAALSDLAKTIGSAMLEAFSGNLVAVLAGQVSTIAATADQFVEQFNDPAFGGNEFTSRIAYILRTELISKDYDGLGLLGAVLYAMQTTIPSVNNELVYIRKMKAALKKSYREATALPSVIQPNLPNAEVSDILCQAAKHVSNVHYRLRNERVWDKSEFGAATAKVCEAKDVIASGKISKTFAYQLKNLYGLTDMQANVLTSFKFIPSPQFRLATLQLIFYGNAIQRADPPIRAFHQNFLDLVGVLESLLSLHSADFLAQIVQLLFRMIQDVRRQLQASGAGFSLTTDGTVDVNIYGVDWKALGVPPPKGSDLREPPTPQVGGQDISSYLGSQAGAYATLTALCFLMQRTQQLQNTLQRLVSANSKIIKQIKAVIARFDVSQCGDIEGAALIDTTLKSYLTAAEERLRGRTTNNRDVQLRAADLRGALDAREKYLRCLLERLTGGNAELLAGVQNVAAAVAAVRQIAALAATSDQIQRSFGTLSFGDSSTTVNVLDTIVQALQCFILQCENPTLSDLAQKAVDYFSAARGRSKAKALTFGQLDRLPRAATKAGTNSRLAALLRLILSLQKLTSPDIADLCNIKARVVTSPPPIRPNDLPPSPVDPAAAARSEAVDRGTLAPA